MLSVTGLQGGYGRINILNGVDLQVGEGEFLGILGHNGMGKTTLLKALMGLIPATAGEIRLDDRPITTLPTHRRVQAGLGYVPQGRQIFPDLSVYENLLMGCARDASASRATVERVLEHFPRLRRLLERRGGGLSGGEQQLLALARCLCGGPKIMLLDEPTEGIQPSIIDEMIDTLKLISTSEKMTIILVEQNLEFLMELAERLLILQRGRIREELRGEQVRDAAALAHELM
jgi:branched-chain amino acid transport system ATP-binding protein